VGERVQSRFRSGTGGGLFSELLVQRVGDFGGVAVPMTCNLQGVFTVAPDETASGLGKGTCAFSGGSGSGTWTVGSQ